MADGYSAIRLEWSWRTMPQPLLLMLTIVGYVAGTVLYWLPSWLFYRRATWLPEDDFLAAFPGKRWVTRAMYSLLPLGFGLAVLLLTTNDNVGTGMAFFFPVFFGCFGALPAIPELAAGASIRVPIGHGSRGPVLYTVSPNAPRAAVFRMAAAAVIIAAFLWCR